MSERGAGRSLFNPFDIAAATESGVRLSDLPHELQQLLKKVGKKDLETRTKALVALIDTVPKTDLESIRIQLSRIYVKNAMDNERKIRELSNRLLLEIIKKDNKFIAPILNDILIVWLGALKDPMVAVSNYAKSAFIAAFPMDKVTVLCKTKRKFIFSKCIEVVQGGAETDMKAMLEDG